MKSIVDIRSKEDAEVFRARLEALELPTYATRRWESDKRVTVCLCCGTIRYDKLKLGVNVLYCDYCEKPHVFSGEINPWFEQPEYNPSNKLPTENKRVLGLLDNGDTHAVFYHAGYWWLETHKDHMTEVDVICWKEIFWKWVEK